MVSESELVVRLREILRTSDLNTTSAGAVRRQLETEFSVDLSHQKKFISHQIDLILHSPDDDDDDDANDDDDDDDGDVNVNEDDQSQEQQQQDEGQEDEGEDEDEEDEDDNEEDSSDDLSKRSKEDEKTEETVKKRKGTGFTRLCSLSPQLQNFVGVSELPRTEVVRKLWAYIKENDLQDPKNRRNIKCDDMLRSIFRVDTVNMFQMNKTLSKHIWPLQSDLDSSTVSLPKEKKQKQQKDEDIKKPKKEEKQKKAGNTGFLKPLQLSEAFVKFLGSGETTLCRSDAVKRVWDYIKQNELQDPSDRRRILCDEKLKELFDVDTFNGFSVTKLLTAHLTKIE